jgi:hypothetical protein
LSELGILSEELLVVLARVDSCYWQSNSLAFVVVVFIGPNGGGAVMRRSFYLSGVLDRVFDLCYNTRRKKYYEKNNFYPARYLNDGWSGNRSPSPGRAMDIRLQPQVPKP